MRPDRRNENCLRDIKIEMSWSPHAEGSCLISFGKTKVLCTASVDEHLPRWLRGQRQGWLTAEYAMLPRATQERTHREVSRGKVSGRTSEIQRLIGRSLRACIDLRKLGERQILIDCDVLQADGGTRTAAITGAWLALNQACNALVDRTIITDNPIHSQIAAVSVGLLQGRAHLDLCYEEDRMAQTDANFVLTARSEIVEVQATAETLPMKHEQFEAMFHLARAGIVELCKHQKQAIAS